MALYIGKLIVHVAIIAAKITVNRQYDNVLPKGASVYTSIAGFKPLIVSIFAIRYIGLTLRTAQLRANNKSLLF
ncbi:MAG: hypothetical protein EBZ77_02105 [Chitinophagia bacterium]|nr:hypothetical protein [Chitinophagia bacterium]